MYVSFNQGQTFDRFNGGLPAVAVHDIAVQPVERELLVATHGRSIWKTSVKELEQINTEMMAKAISLFDLESVSYSAAWGRKSYDGSFFEPSFKIPYYANQTGTAIFTITSEAGTQLASFIDNAEKGLNFATYNFSYDKVKAETLQKETNATQPLPKAENDNYYLQPGKYKITVQLNGNKATSDLVIAAANSGRRSFEPEPKGEPGEETPDKKPESK